ncbi:MAG TPA: DUF2339 domain-containing protein, partial [Candidatus Bathyarchaeia archaeon]|nr:DUF2339 domain-containing protein [Candidatus Bathyarchaeia archaeon]
MSQSNLGAKIFLGFIIFMCLEIFALSTGSFPMAGMVLIAGSVLLIMAFASVGREMMNGSGGNAAQEIAQLHQEMSSLQQRLQQLERGSDAVNSPLAPAPARVEEPVVSHTTVSVTEPEDQGHDSDRRDPDDISTQGEPEVPRNSETDFVRTWVTRVGIAILVLGVSFLVGYTFKYLGPLARILTGYAFSTVLFGLGMYWESRPRYQNFGRALLAGGWALIYFTTYAMYYFPVSRVIQGQVLAGILLFLVSLGMIAHALKYKSEGVFAAALFMAYVTVVIGSITWFSYTAILFLGIALAALSSYFGWMRSLILGTFLTYFIHITRIGPAIPLYMNLVFVTSYWLIFIAGFHFLPRLAKPSYDLRVGGANFGNLFLWSVLGFPLIKELYFDQRLWIVLAAGLCYGGWALFAHHHGKEGLRRSDIFGAIFLITASFPLRFSNDTTLLLWTIEIPFLLYAWIAFREQIFRYAGYVLFFVVSAWMCDMVGSFGSHWSRHEGVLLLYALCTAVCAVLLNWSKTANDPLGDGEVAMDHVFSFASFLAALRLLDLQFSDLKLVSALILVCGFLFVLFAVFRMKRFLWYAYILLFILVC